MKVPGMISQENAILLAEDSEDDVRLLLNAFKRAGLSNPVQVVTNGEEAIRYLSCEAEFSDHEKYPRPSILLLDIKMPRRNGLEVLEWIANQPKLRRLLIIVLSGLEDRHKINRAYELGAHSFLMKPANEEDLRNLVNFFKGYWLIANRPPDCPPTKAQRKA